MGIVRLVKFGRGGDTCFCTGGSTISGYGNPDRPHAGSGEVIPDGTPVLDVRAAVETDAGFSWVFRGPMVDVDLPDGEVDAVNPDPAFAGMLAATSGEFAANLAIHAVSRAKGERAGPLDNVSVAEYVRGWREHGARVGEYRGGVIVWEN